MRFARFLAPICFALESVAAHACTVCDSRNGRQLRAGLFDGHFLHTACLVGAPVPALVLAVVLLQFIPWSSARVASAAASQPVPDELAAAVEAAC